MTTLVFVALARSAPAGGYSARFPDLPGLTVEGAVNKPGIYPITGKTTLLQAIALAGGVHEAFAPANRERLVNMGLDVPRPLRFAIELAEGGLDLQADPLTVDQLADAIARIART